MSRDNAETIEDHIFKALARRGISKECRSYFSSWNMNDPKQFLYSVSKETTLQKQINSVLGESKQSDVLKRGYLERILRYVALKHKAEFPELKSTVLVRTWVRETGQVW